MDRHLLSGIGEIARDHFAVDGIGDGHGAGSCHQAQVAHVRQIVGWNQVNRAGPPQERFNDPAHPLLLQLVGELVEMGLATQDQLLARVLDGGARDLPAAVATGLVPETGLVSQRIHQPGLALRQPPDLVPPLVREHLVRLPGMLCQQGLDLAWQEISEPQGFGPNVECAATGDDGVFGPGPNSVVTHVTHTAQNHALGKPLGAVRVTGPELTQYRQQRVAHQRVDLVDHEHERLGVGFGPSGQRLPQRVVGARCF